jgi:hypothetical protein
MLNGIKCPQTLRTVFHDRGQCNAYDRGLQVNPSEFILIIAEAVNCTNGIVLA